MTEITIYQPQETKINLVVIGKTARLKIKNTHGATSKCNLCNYPGHHEPEGFDHKCQCAVCRGRAPSGLLEDNNNG